VPTDERNISVVKSADGYVECPSAHSDVLKLAFSHRDAFRWQCKPKAAIQGGAWQPPPILYQKTPKSSYCGYKSVPTRRSTDRKVPGISTPLPLCAYLAAYSRCFAILSRLCDTRTLLRTDHYCCYCRSIVHHYHSRRSIHRDYTCHRRQTLCGFLSLRLGPVRPMLRFLAVIRPVLERNLACISGDLPLSQVERIRIYRQALSKVSATRTLSCRTVRCAESRQWCSASALRRAQRFRAAF
jgi:hypothetical protein